MLQSNDGVAQNAEVLKELRRSRPDLVGEFARELMEVALVKLINDAARKGIKGSKGQPILVGYKGVPAFVSIGPNRKKATLQLTLSEADDASAPRVQPVEDRNQGFRRLVDDCRDHFAADKDTLETALRRKRGWDQPELF
ncbi:MAG: hypothetical protein EOP84_36795 [Verrucomicrobiaceae bacterium]|nr:MAG: hypothetical protein EOP84_36795 [Verrucomicrobiaceae bacterium]